MYQQDEIFCGCSSVLFPQCREAVENEGEMNLKQKWEEQHIYTLEKRTGENIFHISQI